MTEPVHCCRYHLPVVCTQLAPRWGPYRLGPGEALRLTRPDLETCSHCEGFAIWTVERVSTGIAPG